MRRGRWVARTADQPITAGTLRHWELFYVVVYLGAVTAVWLQPDPVTTAKTAATALLCAMACWYWWVGHGPLVTSAAQLHPRVGWRWLAGTLLLFLAAIACAGNAAWVTPAAMSQAFWLLPMRIAAPVVVAVSFAPGIRDLAFGDDVDSVLRELAPAAAIFCVLGLLLGYVITQLGEHNDRQAELISSLEASRADVARLSREAGSSAERDRLAREIHDTLAQGFTSIIALTQAAESELDTDPAAARRHLALATRTARENLAEARAMVAALTPSALGGGSLEDAVRRQAERFTEETGIAMVCEIGAPLPRLRTAAEVVLLRAAQEALANVRKHAAATSVRLVLACADSRVRLLVRDDGRGFHAGTGGGYGLRGMRARADEVGGHLTIHSGPGEGTAVELEVPVDPDHAG
ncbi:sensor histidine kinase [Saccharomonospora sp. NPDC046836]|uniref:sensor histidine kinase n=1 Tax=Saccharomonospora sp. NPDC046836 TaxID=3156921 RepID=UPI003401B4CD